MVLAYCQQERPTFCFLACLESFFAENGFLISQDEVLARVPAAFGLKANDLGAFSPQSHPLVEAEFKIKWTALGHNFVLPNIRTESVFVMTFWEGRQDQVHWVRLLKVTSTHVFLMNPQADHAPERRARGEFQSWAIYAACVQWQGGVCGP